MKQSMKELNTYIWDLDGTLLDSYDCIVTSLVNLTGEYRMSDSYANIMMTVKRGSVSSYLRDLSWKTSVDFEQLFERYRELSGEHLNEISLMPGALETLTALRDRGVEHFVYTHRGKSTKPILDRLGITEFFKEIVTYENGFKLKPSGDGVKYLVSKYGLVKPETAYVGDRTRDVYCARDAGVKAILYMPADSCIPLTGVEDCIIRKLTDLIE